MCVGRTARNSKAPVTKGVTYACFVCFFFVRLGERERQARRQARYVQVVRRVLEFSNTS